MSSSSNDQCDLSVHELRWARRHLLNPATSGIPISMIVRSNTRSSTSLRILCDTAATFGISAEICLKDTGISVADLEDPNSVHDTNQEIQVIENFVQQSTHNIGLGWTVGRKMHVNAFGIWGFAILTSPTLRAAIQTAVDFINLSSVIADMSLIETGREGQLVFTLDGLPRQVHRFVAERHIAVAASFISELIELTDYEKFRIEISDTDDNYGAELSKLSRISVHSSSKENALCFPLDLLDRTLPKSDPATLKFCLDQCKILSEQQKNAFPPWSQKVRNTIIEDIETDQKIEDVSGKLSVAPRTLRRRLSEEGTSFRTLYVDVRLTLAHELLETAGLNIETVAWRVGYSEPASFARAFTKKYGTTPGEVRRSSSGHAA